MPPPAMPSLLHILALVILLPLSNAQYQKGTSKYEQAKVQGEDTLVEQIRSHDDTKAYFYPEKLFDDIDIYRTEIPLSQEYTIAIMVSPCGDNSTSVDG